MAAGSGVAGLFSGPEVQEDPGHAAALVSQLKQLYEAGLLCDVTLRVPGGPEEEGGRSFRCNRNVLSAACPYFRSMFTGGLYESKQQEVTLHDVSPESMALIIDYCYTGRVTVSEGNVQNLYAAADMLQLEYVRQACANYLTRHLDHHNCASILRFAEAFHHPELRASALAFIARHFEQLATGEELCELSLAQVKAVLAMDNLDVASEKSVCGAALQWLEANPQEMADGWQEVLGCVRWQHFTEKEQPYLDSVRSKVSVHKPCLQYLDSVLPDKEKPAARSPASQENGPLPRIGMTAKHLIILVGHKKLPYLGYEPYSCDLYTIPSPVSDMPRSKALSIAVCVSPENDLYLVARPVGKLWVYSPVCNSWQLLAEGLLARDCVDIAYLDGYVYIAGGCDPTTAKELEDVECYSVQRNQVVLVAPLLHSESGIELAVCKDRLYSISPERVMCYDPTCNEWLNCPSIVQRYIRNVCVFNNEIFCLCDYTTVRVYNPTLGKWDTKYSIPEQENVSKYELVRHGSKLLLITVIDAEWRKSRLTIHEYDATNDQWVHIHTMLGLLNYDDDFIVLSARLYPSFLESGQKFITEEEEISSQSSDDGYL